MEIKKDLLSLGRTFNRTRGTANNNIAEIILQKKVLLPFTLLLP